MSEALRERLKRAGRCYKSPASKKLRTDSSETTASSPLTVPNLDDSGVGVDLPCTPINDPFGTPESGTVVTGSSRLTSSQPASSTSASYQEKQCNVAGYCRTSNVDNPKKSTVDSQSTIDETQTQSHQKDGHVQDHLNSDIKLNDAVKSHCRLSAIDMNISPSHKGLISSDKSTCTPTSSSETPVVEQLNTYKNTSHELRLTGASSEELRQLRNDLLHRLEQKEETLRKLNMVKMYRTKVSAPVLQPKIVSLLCFTLPSFQVQYGDSHFEDKMVAWP